MSSGAFQMSDFQLLWGRHGCRPAITQAGLWGPCPSSLNQGPLHAAVLETLRTGSLGALSGRNFPQAHAAALHAISRLPFSPSAPWIKEEKSFGKTGGPWQQGRWERSVAGIQVKSLWRWVLSPSEEQVSETGPPGMEPGEGVLGWTARPAPV